jgi:hypothetical protein
MEYILPEAKAVTIQIITNRVDKGHYINLECFMILYIMQNWFLCLSFYVFFPDFRKMDHWSFSSKGIPFS